jgi:hypothetical protein
MREHLALARFQFFVVLGTIRVSCKADNLCTHPEICGAVQTVTSKGWFQCRDCTWQMHTLYPDGSVDCPRVQVFDAEHLITQIRNDAESLKDGGKVHSAAFGPWRISRSNHGHIVVTHKRERDQILVLMSSGFTFVSSEGHAVLVDENGLNKLSFHEAQALRAFDRL